MPPRRKTVEEEKPAKKQRTDRVAPKPESFDEYAPDEGELGKMQAVMGFSGFATSKNKDHSASDCFASIKISRRKTKRMVQPRTR